MIKVECPECGEQFETDADALFLFNRFYCSACDVLLEVIEEDPLVLEAIDEDFYDAEDGAEDDDWAGE